MKQALPGIRSVAYIKAEEVEENVVERAAAGLPVAVYHGLQEIETDGRAEATLETKQENGDTYEKATLTATTTDDVPKGEGLAFVIEDTNGNNYLIGRRERPQASVEVTHKIGEDKNAKEVKVTFVAKMAMIACYVG